MGRGRNKGSGINKGCEVPGWVKGSGGEYRMRKEVAGMESERKQEFS